MDPITLSIILGIIDGSFKLLANHVGKPDGWVPTPEDWIDLNDLVNQSSPEAVRAQARERLGLPPLPEVPPLE